MSHDTHPAGSAQQQGSAGQQAPTAQLPTNDPARTGAGQAGSRPPDNPNRPSTPAEPQPAAGPATSVARAEDRAAEAPLSLESPSETFEVVIDQWGSVPGTAEPRFVRGDRVAREDAPAGFDLEFAERQGVIRRLTVAEARTNLPSSTQSLLADGTLDESLAERGLYHGGLALDPSVAVDAHGMPVTVTGPQGPAEPPELAKPTLPGPENNQPAARPVLQTDEALSHLEIARRAADEQADREAEQARHSPRKPAARRTTVRRRTGPRRTSKRG